MPAESVPFDAGRAGSTGSHPLRVRSRRHHPPSRTTPAVAPRPAQPTTRPSVTQTVGWRHRAVIGASHLSRLSVAWVGYSLAQALRVRRRTLVERGAILAESQRRQDWVGRLQ